ncbi:unnamed protein product [Blepharisma stoltei]|uniref:Nuclear nucleic acid-binding protein C1D n=1 Tax=Blepharisma stoltei TaxID=1481888 RepID=A0AAU9IV26_9CILI|nr:unnamed protein product [Blepharisma stoltei]
MEEMSKNLSSLSEALDDITNQIQPLFEHESLSQLNLQLTPEDSLKMNTAIAYTLHSLYYILLKTQGNDLSDHPLKKEIDRVKEYVSKVQKFLSSPTPPPTRIDKQEAARLITANIEGKGRVFKGSTPLPQAGHLKWKEDVDRILGKK